MSMFQEEQVSSKSPYADFKLGEADNDTVWFFYFDNQTTANSPEYGEFTILQGLGFDGELKTQDELLKSAVLNSFIPNTLIHNIMKNGGIVRGEAYKIVKKWTKGDSFDPKDKKKKAKGHGYEFFRLKAPDSFLNALKAKHDSLVPGVIKDSGDTSADTSAIDV